MSLFAFIKDVGDKLFGSKTAETTTESTTASVDESAKAEAAITEAIHDLDLHVENLCVSLDGDTATISGTAMDQSTKEKVILVVGNTMGIAMVNDQMDVKHQAPEAQFHTVSKGDTLGKIAQQYYGNAMKYPEIFEANKPMLKDPNLIYPGQVLRIPIVEN
ncbi:LysM domain/BON superfamily protein [Kordia sp. SMS9]|uniref:peptidoglycan-binding protein LysM n=1 Tax=Kordia sp. SMS9 TaxID=2282170 RepID=UPI000E0DEFD9|nr:peptidoglycan-binding protein LysM [Kordia sp. SMS9]AXG68705.1 LysM domain/BON superfamily protein [Kordia sp. SMS9]